MTKLIGINGFQIIDKAKNSKKGSLEKEIKEEKNES